MSFRNMISLNSFAKNVNFMRVNQLNNGFSGFSTTSKVSDIFNIQDEADFKKKVLESKKPVVVDFHATWCEPCKTLMPRLETIIGGTKDAVDLAKVDIDDLSDIAMDYSVGAVPSVLFFKNGEVQDKFVGLQDNDQIQKFVDKLRKG